MLNYALFWKCHDSLQLQRLRNDEAWGRQERHKSAYLMTKTNDFSTHGTWGFILVHFFAMITNNDLVWSHWRTSKHKVKFSTPFSISIAVHAVVWLTDSQRTFWIRNDSIGTIASRYQNVNLYFGKMQAPCCNKGNNKLERSNFSPRGL